MCVKTQKQDVSDGFHASCCVFVSVVFTFTRFGDVGCVLCFVCALCCYISFPFVNLIFLFAPHGFCNLSMCFVWI